MAHYSLIDQRRATANNIWIKVMALFIGLLCPVAMAQTQMAAEMEAFADRHVADARESSVIPGVTLAIVKDGDVALLKGYGWADLDNEVPVDPETTVFQIGSVSKTFAGIAVMQLVEQGRLDLDTDVNEYLQDFRIPDTFDQPITLRALLSHRTGFEDLPMHGFFHREAERVPVMKDYLATHIPKRVYPPGEVSSYSNYGVALAGHIVEVVSGTDFASYAEQEIFAPLSMRRSTFREPLLPGHPNAMDPQLAEQIATGYHEGESGGAAAQPFAYISNIGPAGSVLTTADDMANYMLALLNGGAFRGERILDPETWQAMGQRLYTDRPLATDIAHLFFDGQLQGYRFKSHSGGSTTFKTNMTLYPELNLGVFVSVNSDDGGSQFADTLHQRLLETFFEPENQFTAQPPPDSSTQWNRYTGTYQNSLYSHTTVGKLLQASTREVGIDDEGYLVVSDGSQSGRYVALDEGVFRRVEGDISDVLHLPLDHIYFFGDSAGRPAWMTRPVTDAYRVSLFETRSFMVIPILASTLLAILVLLSSWTRTVRTNTRQGSDHWIRYGSVALASVIVLTLLAFIPLMLNPSSTTELAFTWPDRLLPVLYGILAITAFTALNTALLIPLWTSSSFGAVRRAFYTLFTVVCLLLIATLWQWNLVGLNY